MRFIKMQATGNDYVYVDTDEEEVKDPASLARAVSAPHFGIGGDGLVLYGAKNGTGTMRIFNKDGSEGKICGNALRAVAKILYESGKMPGEKFIVSTASGEREVVCNPAGKKVISVTVCMGAPDFAASSLPMCAVGEKAVDYPVFLEGKCYFLTCLSVGNPHAVTFVKSVHAVDVSAVGNAISASGLFPQGINVEFAEQTAGGALCRVFERGSGETLSCGSGACAVAAALLIKKEYAAATRVTVEMPGGALSVERVDGKLYLTGPAEEVFRGEYRTLFPI